MSQTIPNRLTQKLTAAGFHKLYHLAQFKTGKQEFVASIGVNIDNKKRLLLSKIPATKETAIIEFRMNGEQCLPVAIISGKLRIEVHKSEKRKVFEQYQKPVRTLYKLLGGDKSAEQIEKPKDLTKALAHILRKSDYSPNTSENIKRLGFTGLASKAMKIYEEELFPTDVKLYPVTYGGKPSELAIKMDAHHPKKTWVWIRNKDELIGVKFYSNTGALSDVWFLQPVSARPNGAFQVVYNRHGRYKRVEYKSLAGRVFEMDETGVADHRNDKKYLDDKEFQGIISAVATVLGIKDKCLPDAILIQRLVDETAKVLEGTSKRIIGHSHSARVRSIELSDYFRR